MKKAFWFSTGFIVAGVILGSVNYFDLKRREEFGNFNLYETTDGANENLIITHAEGMALMISADEGFLHVRSVIDKNEANNSGYRISDATYDFESEVGVTWVHYHEDGSSSEWHDENADGIPESKHVFDSDNNLVNKYIIELREIESN